MRKAHDLEFCVGLGWGLPYRKRLGGASCSGGGPGMEAAGQRSKLHGFLTEGFHRLQADRQNWQDHEDLPTLGLLLTFRQSGKVAGTTLETCADLQTQCLPLCPHDSSASLPEFVVLRKSSYLSLA